MRVLFYHQVAHAIGIEYLSAALRADGHDVELIFDPGFASHPTANLSLLKALGPSDREVLERIRAFQPDLIALSVLTNLYPAFRRFAALVRAEMDVPILVGGPHATMLPEAMLRDPNVDYVCDGEGEDVIRDLARALERRAPVSEVAGLWSRDAHGLPHAGPPRALREDLDALPFPDRALFRREGIVESATSVSTLRGCPYRCGYCTNTALQERYAGRGRFLRRRSVDNVIEELAELRDRDGVRHIAFVDELFALDPGWLEHFAERYRERVALPFYCTGHPFSLTRRVVDALERAGCAQLCMGVEAGADGIRADARGTDIERRQIVEAATRVRRAGIFLYSTCMFGLPGETPEDMWETVDLVEDTKADSVKSFVFYPFPGTPLLDTCVRDGLLDPDRVRAIEEGRGSYHGRPLLDHPHGELAFVLSRSLPTYRGLPGPLKRAVRLVMRRQWQGMARALYLAAYPLTVDHTHVIDFLRIVVASARSRLRWRRPGARFRGTDTPSLRPALP